MRHVFFKGNARLSGGTEITRIKSTHYHAQCNKDGVLKYGNAIASSIEIEYYIGSQTDLAVGDPIWYYQAYDRNLRDFSSLVNEQFIFIGKFFVDSFSKNGKIARFVAFDTIKKLDVDYSPRLLANKANFPMTVKDLLDDIAAYTGIPISTSWAIGIRDSVVNYFYVDGITARTLVSQIFELLGYDLYVYYQTDTSTPEIIQISYSTTNGTITGFRYAPNRYIVAPTDQQSYYSGGQKLVNIFYKENGIHIGDDVYDPIDCVKVVKTDGTVLGSYGNTEDNVYYIKNNIIAEHINAFYNASALSGTLSHITAVNSSPKVSTNLFPFRFAFDLHGITFFADTDNSVKPFPIMNIDWTDERVLMESYGASVQSYEDNDVNNMESQTAALASVLNNFSGQINQNTSDISDLQTDVGDVSTLSGFTATDLAGAANELKTDISAVEENFTDAYDDTATYAVGDLCIYENVLYRCVTAVTAAEAFDSAKWTATTVEDELDTVEAAVSGKVSKSGDTMTGALTLNTPLAVASGGTGADNASSALSNLGGLPYVNLTNMTANTTAALTTALNADITAIPTGVSVVRCGNSSNSNRCALLVIRASTTVGKAFSISAYTALHNIFLTLGTSGWAVG